MSRSIATSIRSLAVAAVTLASVTACQKDGPVEPAQHPEARTSATDGSAVGIKNKPTLHFVGILFSGGTVGSKGEIYSMNPDGSGLFRLTNDDVTDAYPDVSPNGPSFVWARFSPDGQSSELYTQNLDGSKRKRLTYLNSVALSPRYSPDGTKIAFMAMVPGAGAEIFTMNSDGTGVARITTSANNSQGPSWSPDGSMIAFQSSDNFGIPSVWVMYASGGQQKLLLSCPAPGCTHPKWSPVANEIAVERIDGSGIFVIDATTGAQTAYIPSSVNDMTPTWSKDGKLIIFSSLRAQSGGYDLFSTEPLRGGASAPPPVVRLTTLSGDEALPAYSR
jgi:Tol biopolymer transport system component